MTSKPSIPVIIDKRFLVGDKIGSGSFGVVYTGRNIKTGEPVAIKMENVRCKFPQILYEGRLYRIVGPNIGWPQVHFSGVISGHNVMVMEFLGPCLEDLFDFCGRKFSLKTVLILADQLISRIECLHSSGIIHRDIKPENFLMGRSRTSHHIYIIDLGLAKRYIDEKTGEHIPFAKGKSLTGTARYTSVNSHLGYEQSRRDDLESIGFLLVYFLKGSLPWQGLHAVTKEQKYSKISQKKISTSVEELCRRLPNEFLQFFQYIRALKFTEKPNYDYLRLLFRRLFNRKSYTLDFMYDWVHLKNSTYGSDNQ